MQNEDACSITEALLKIRKVLDKEGININSFMIDKSAAEIKALKTVFPGEYISFFGYCKDWYYFAILSTVFSRVNVGPNLYRFRAVSVRFSSDADVASMV